MIFSKAALTIYKVARRFSFFHNPFDKVAVPLFTFRNLLDNVDMTIGKVPMTFHTFRLTLFSSRNLSDTFRMTILNSFITLDKSSMTKTEIQATH